MVNTISSYSEENTQDFQSHLVRNLKGFPEILSTHITISSAHLLEGKAAKQNYSLGIMVIKYSQFLLKQ